MKNFILYYYNLEITDYISQDTYYYIETKTDIYYFCKVRKSEEELTKIYEELSNTNYHLLIKSKYNRYLVEYNKESYCLLKVRCLLNDTINFQEIKNNRPLIRERNTVDWSLIWQEKIDYLEEQANSFLVGKNSLIHSFIYFVGLGENAISYLNYNNFKSHNLSVCHYRVYYPNKPVNYYNSLNTLIDYDIRDYAEYIKEVFYQNKDYDCLNLVREILLDKRYTRDDFGLFYARMLYPSYFFDCFSKYILEDKLKEEELMAILERVDDYETFLKDTYYEIKKVYDIPEITWLLKKSNKSF